MAPAPPGRTERVGYHEGQLLAARDLRDDSRHESRLRGLHLRSLHGSWGVALGLLSVVEGGGHRVRVGPGLAYDCRGCEIVLSEEISVGGPVPQAGTTATLLYDLVCSAASPVDHRSRAERPQLRWVVAGPAGTGTVVPVADQVRLGEEVPLGRFAVAPDATMTGPDPIVRRTARAELRPHVASGVVESPNLGWHATANGLSVVVDTSSAGFTEPPFYFAHLAVNPWLFIAKFGPFLSMADSEPTSFRVNLSFPGVSSPDNLLDAATIVVVSWVGVEPFAGCPPSVTFPWLPVAL